jgi:hypothetical protein
MRRYDIAKELGVDPTLFQGTQPIWLVGHRTI